jgi:hypothetical protein
MLPPPARRLTRFAAGLSIIGLFLALGRYGPFAWLLIETPLLNRFRVPARYLLLVHLGLAMLAAVSLDGLLRRPDGGWGHAACRARKLALVPALGALCCGVVWAWQRHGPGGLPPLGSPTRILFNIPLAAMASALVFLISYRPRLGLVGIILFTIGDQALYFLHLTIWEPGTVRTIREALRDLPEFPRLAAGYRLHVPSTRPGTSEPLPDAPCQPGQVSLAGLAMTGGYVSLTPRSTLDYQCPESRRLAGVAWSWDERTRNWMPEVDPMPRARLVSRVIVGDAPEQIIGLDPRTTAVVSEPLPALDESPGQASIRQDRPGSLVSDVSVPGRQLLVWNESYHPGWTLTIDGVRRTPLRVNLDFLGCLVPPGRHTVAFRFRPRSFQVGAWISSTGMAILAMTSLLGARRRRVAPAST